MDYEEKYKSALKWMQSLYGGLHGATKEEAEKYFPELKESEDEKVRKALIEYFNEQCDMSDWNGIYGYQVVAWLEKQGEHTELDESEDESIRNALITLIKFGLEDGSAIAPGFNVTKEQALVWLKKQEQESKKVSIWKHWKNGICGNGEGKQIYLIKMGNTYSLSSCLGFECDYIELSELDNLMLEKQNKQNFDYEHADIPQKDFAPIEPKFKVRDWLQYRNAEPFLVEEITEQGYCNGNSCLPFEWEDEIHLWDIQDAEDGDVLVDVYGNIGIFKKCYDFDWMSYCSLGNNGGFQVFTVEHENEKTYPATKEQCKLLFQKMKEDGWEWDAEKKELKTIEQKSTDNIGSKFKVEDYIVPNNDAFLEIWRIINIDKDGYYNIQCITNSEYDEIYRIPAFVLEQDYRCWTIQDAKDGDVLVASDGSIFLFAGVDGSACKYYVAIATDNHVEINKETKGGYWETSRAVYPATKEQRDLLFQKMADAGYEFVNGHVTRF